MMTDRQGASAKAEASSMQHKMRPRKRPGPKNSRCRQSGASNLSISPLGPMRWHIQFAQSAPGHRREIYLAPEDGGLLYVTRVRNCLEIRLNGRLSEDCVRNLGDCLVAAICEHVEHMALWLGETEIASPEACSMFESFGRSLARERLPIKFEVHGEGRGLQDLTEAFRQGFARSARRRDAR